MSLDVIITTETKKHHIKHPESCRAEGDYLVNTTIHGSMDSGRYVGLNLPCEKVYNLLVDTNSVSKESELGMGTIISLANIRGNKYLAIAIGIKKKKGEELNKKPIAFSTICNVSYGIAIKENNKLKLTNCMSKEKFVELYESLGININVDKILDIFSPGENLVDSWIKLFKQLGYSVHSLTEFCGKIVGDLSGDEEKLLKLYSSFLGKSYFFDEKGNSVSVEEGLNLLEEGKGIVRGQMGLLLISLKYSHYGNTYNYKQKLIEFLYTEKEKIERLDVDLEKLIKRIELSPSYDATMPHISNQPNLVLKELEGHLDIKKSIKEGFETSVWTYYKITLKQ